MTSLPDHEALCHVRASIIQRSRGKSAVAAAAYRAAARLTDARTGQVWDYSRKRNVTDSYVMAPAGSAAWVYDREALWSRVELAERRKDAQTARELQIAIPRDLPRNRWGAFISDVGAPYLAAGAVLDVALHEPRAADKGEQPHVHILITVRALDPESPTGFAPTRNAAVAALLTSGGSHGGGARGDALKRERERVAGIINDHLRRAGSKRRADHRSYAARDDPRIPEPPITERRKATVMRRRKHDRRTAVVAGIRQARQIENELIETEKTMALTARGFPRAPARQTKAPHQQDYKESLLRDRFPDAILPPGISDALYLVDVRDPRRTRVLLRDGAWVESDDEGGTVSTWGSRSQNAAALAEAISVSTGYGIDRVERTATAAKPGKNRRKSAVSEDEATSLADKWRRRGFSDVVESPAGVRVGVGGRSRLVDSGDHVDLFGPVSDESLRALAAKAAEDWGGSLTLDGPWPEEAKGRLWTECQRQGITLADYTPPPAVAAAWAAESGSVATTETKLRAVRSETAEADLLLGAAAGDVASLKRLEPSLRAFVGSHLDDDQRRDLAKSDREDIVAALGEFRQLGAAELERQKKERLAGRPSIFDAPPKPPADAPAVGPAPGSGDARFPITPNRSTDMPSVDDLEHARRLHAVGVSLLAAERADTPWMPGHISCSDTALNRMLHDATPDDWRRMATESPEAIAAHLPSWREEGAARQDRDRIAASIRYGDDTARDFLDALDGDEVALERLRAPEEAGGDEWLADRVPANVDRAHGWRTFYDRVRMGDDDATPPNERDVDEGCEYESGCGNEDDYEALGAAHR